MIISNIEKSSLFKVISGEEIQSKYFFYIKSDSEKYEDCFFLLQEIIEKYGALSVVGFGFENNIYNRGKLIMNKIGYFGQNDFKSFSLKNSLNLRSDIGGRNVYLSHYVGPFSDLETFYKVIHNKDRRIYLEIIDFKCDSENKLLLKGGYVGVDSYSCIRLLFGFDIKENLYLFFLGDKMFLDLLVEDLNFCVENSSEKVVVDRITFLEKNTNEMLEILNVFKDELNV